MKWGTGRKRQLPPQFVLWNRLVGRFECDMDNTEPFVLQGFVNQSGSWPRSAHGEIAAVQSNISRVHTHSAVRIVLDEAA